MDPLEVITEGCWLALRLGLDVSAKPTGNLRMESGVYLLGAGKTYHPLESVLVSTTGSGDWRADGATVLGVDQDWISGFLDGFAQQPESSTGAEYIQGYLVAEQLRMSRYRRELPDR